MPVYSYKAKDRNGNTRTGMVDASDEHQAASIIRENGMWPMQIKLAGTVLLSNTPDNSKSVPIFAKFLIDPIWTGVNIKKLALFYRQLAVLLSSGMPLSEALSSIGNRTSGRLKKIVEEARNEVQQGKPISDVFCKYPRFFSLLQLSLIRAGEASGLLETMVDRIASYLEYEISVRQRIAKATFYPILVFIFILLITTFLPYLPIIVTQNFSEFLKAVWPGLRAWILYLVIAIVSLKLIFQFYLPRLFWDRVKIIIPILGPNAYKVAMSRFSRALAALYSAGLPISEAVSISADASANLSIGNKIKMAVPAIRTGEGISLALERTQAISQIVMDMISTGEKTGNLDAVLHKVADYIDSELDSSIHKIGTGLFVFGIILAAIIVLKVAIDFYSGYFNTVLERGTNAN